MLGWLQRKKHKVKQRVRERGNDIYKKIEREITLTIKEKE